MNYNFSDIQGPKKSSYDNFELLICQLLEAELNAISINGAGGDGGIDCYRINESGDKEIIQVKYFIDSLKPTQKQQIKKSLDKAINNQKIVKWILCIPHDHSPNEKFWFDSIKPINVKTEWWGETKIRNLLSKYPEIGRQFFRSEKILKELARFENEIKQLLFALDKRSSSRIKNENKHEDAPSLYLSRALDICKILSYDFRLFKTENYPLIPIDIYDIALYSGIDSRYNAVEPVVDYCFENSPVPFSILPASVVELKEIMNYLRITTIRCTKKAKQSIDEKVLDDFMQAFAANPNSSETIKNFTKIYDDYSKGFNAITGFSKIHYLINSNKIKFAEEEEEAISKDKSEFVFNSIIENSKLKLLSIGDEHTRYRYLENRYRDAINIAYIFDKSKDDNDSVRMISSSLPFIEASKSLFPNISPIRTLYQFSYLIYFLKNTDIRQVDKLFGQIEHMGISIKQLLYLVENNRILDNLQSTAIAFECFTPYYKMVFQPVDKMIYSAYSSMPKYVFTDMYELYEFLSKEAKLIKAFEDWWNLVSEKLRSVNSTIPDYKETKALLSNFKKNNH